LLINRETLGDSILLVMKIMLLHISSFKNALISACYHFWNRKSE